MPVRPALFIAAITTTLATLLPATPAAAGTAGDYPEFPYPATDYNEPHRGQFHFSPRGGWMNDINAPLYYDGLYHVFFQHNPHGLQWDTMHWGHATSPDLVRWTQKPIALEPGVHTGNLFSGGGVVDHANTAGLATGGEAPIILFTGTDGVSIAYSNDGAKTFQQYDGGRKVITMPANSRDPKVFWHAGTGQWVLVVWSDVGGNAAHFYSSRNLVDWTFRSRYAADWLFECPDVFPLSVDGDGPTKWVLTDASGEYVVGSFDGATFTADSPDPKRMDHGDTGFTGTFYGPLTFNNLPDGRVVQMAWMPGNRGSTWTGNASFPVRLDLRDDPDGLRVTRTPVAEIAGLRTRSATWSDRTIGPGTHADPLQGTSGDTYEISAEFDTTYATAARFGFRLHTRADGTYERSVTYDRHAATLNGVPMAARQGRVKIRILVDRGQLEFFGNDGRVSVTDNVDFGADPAGQGIRTYAEGGTVRLVSLQVHHLGSAWGHGESTLAGNLRGPWRTAGGTWSDVTAGKQGEAAGDGFYLSDQTGTDFTYQADVRLDTAAAAALTFRANDDASAHYTVNVDAAGLVKLWRPGRDIAVYRTPIVRGRTYHLKVIARGDLITVYLDHSPVPVIDAVDTARSSGRFGINVFAGLAVVQNANVDTDGWRTGIRTGWHPVAGTWTVPGDALQGRSTGNGFSLSERRGSDFTYEGDLRVTAGRAAGLTFRAGADAREHYTANIDTDGMVKLWRPGRDIATFPTAVVPGRTYHLKVVARGASIKVYLNRSPTPVIDAVDNTYAEGLFGVNTFDCVGAFQDVTVN